MSDQPGFEARGVKKTNCFSSFSMSTVSPSRLAAMSSKRSSTAAGLLPASSSISARLPWLASEVERLASSTMVPEASIT